MNDRWTQLEQSPVDRPRRRIHPESSQNLFLQLSFPDRHRQLALVLPPGTNVDSATQATRALIVRQLLEPTSTILVIELCEPDLGQVFDALVDDVAAQVAATDTTDAAVAVVTVRLAHWSDLFRRLRSGVALDDDERRGLFGELHVLDTLIEARGTSAAGAWTGPYALSQDFQFGAVAIEVKTTARTLPHTVQIPNERELDPHGLQHLILTRLVVDEHPIGGPGVSLNEQVAAVRSRLNSNATHLETFEGALSRNAYVPGVEYEEPLYSIRTKTHWAVRDDFPRITAGDVRPGVADVRYAVDPTAFVSYEITDDMFATIIREPS